MRIYHDKKWAARRYDCSEHTISAWVKNGYIPFVRCGRMVRFDERSLDEWDRQRAIEGRTQITPQVA